MPQQIPQKSGRLATTLGAVLVGNDGLTLRNFTTPEFAESDSLVWADNPANLLLAVSSPACAVLTTPKLVENLITEKTFLLTEDLQAALLTAARAFHSPTQLSAGVHRAAFVDATATLLGGVHVGAGAYVGPRCKLGSGVVVHAGASIGAGCQVGDYTVLHPNVTLYDEVIVGRKCILHAGCVIGAEGFGYVPTKDGLAAVPHLGTVIIGDGVDIGANSCIDRAKLGATTIGAGSKIDNLVHIGHNVSIGRSCIVVAQAGLAGTVKVGDGVMIAGQAGIADHITIGDGARVAAQAGVIGDVAAGETVSGYPARPHRVKMRELGAVAALPAAIKRLKQLESLVQELQQKRAHDE